MKTSKVLTCLTGLLVATQIDIDAVDTRSKRQLYSPPLVAPYGGTFKLIIGVGIPITLSGRALAYGQNFQFQYALPTNATFFTNYFAATARRRRRSSSSREREIAYSMLQQQFERHGLDGKECLMRGICEAAETSLQEEGLIGELLHLLLTPDYGGNVSIDEEYLKAKEAGLHGDNCTELFSGCPQGYGILDHVSTIKYLQ